MIRTAFGTEPDVTQGCTFPTVEIFQDITQKGVMMPPLGTPDGGERSQNEKVTGGTT